ncbi:MAG: hypothetical protein XD78_0336 [Desulfotomaculum sp. 46_296]|nr:MAG: hypothetical protein XD78_0336 [Desulfotomaculum sp. 46_296]KUK84864.1 MAG: hypothetical protein XE00_0488 [Desulfofundulus kuznetsovii]HAU31633.1 hypothetical protein [Desulfotomaculum sp.]
MISFLPVLNDFLETIGVVALSLVLGQASLLWGRVVVVSLAATAVLYLFKLLPFDYGVLVLIEIVLLAIVISKLTVVPLTKCIIIVSASLIILLVLKYFTNYFSLTIGGVNVHLLLNSNIFLGMAGLLHALLMIIFAELVLKFCKPVQDSWKKEAFTKFRF